LKKIVVKKTITTDTEVFEVDANDEHEALSGMVMSNRVGITTNRRLEVDVLDKVAS